MDFTSSIENVDEVTRKIKITVPAEIVSKEVNARLTSAAGQAKIDGFRPGKAPKAMVEKMYGGSIRAEVAERLINSSLNNVAKENKLEIVGSPEVDLVAFEVGKDMEFTANVQLFPKPEVKGYDKFKVEVQKNSVEEKNVDEIIENLRNSRATTKKLEFRNTAKLGDVIDIQLGVDLEGEAADRPEPATIVLGEKKIPEGVEAEIVGLEIGSSKVVDVILTKEQGGDKYAGKKATYRVTLNGLSERILPEVTDEFAKGLNLGAETVLELRLKVRQELEKELEQQRKGDIQTAILDQLVKANEFKVPQLLVDEELRALIVRSGLMNDAKVQNTDLEPFRKELGEIALRRVKSSIIIDRIVELEGLKAEKEEIDAQIGELSSRSGVSIEEAKKFLMDQNRLIGFIMEITRSKAIDLLVGRAEVEQVEKKAA